MAKRRMIDKNLIESDAFLDMPISSQNLYFHLLLQADDDGFVDAPNKVMRMIGASKDDLRVLSVKKYIIAFDNGIIVIRHWNIHNHIRKDRYIPTIHIVEKRQISQANGIYSNVTAIENDPL